MIASKVASNHPPNDRQFCLNKKKHRNYSLRSSNHSTLLNQNSIPKTPGVNKDYYQAKYFLILQNLTRNLLSPTQHKSWIPLIQTTKYGICYWVTFGVHKVSNNKHAPSLLRKIGMLGTSRKTEMSQIRNKIRPVIQTILRPLSEKKIRIPSKRHWMWWRIQKSAQKNWKTKKAYPSN